MRLLNVRTLEVEAFATSRPRDSTGQLITYAVLSHTWAEEEVSFQDIQNLAKARKMAGFSKILGAIEQAKRDRLNWIWVDTCCIDKTSSSELSEAINCKPTHILPK
jgi:hypothetical protein